VYKGTLVQLRRVDPAMDTDDRYRWLSDLEGTRFLGMRPALVSKEQVRKYLEKCSASTDDLVEFGICTLDGRHIGGCCLRELHKTAHSAEIGILIGEPEFRGKGYGTDVMRLLVKIGFEQFNLNRIWLHVDESNIAGIRAYEKAGFTKEGLLRQSGYAHGSYYSSYSMSILREEYEQGKGRA